MRKLTVTVALLAACAVFLVAQEAPGTPASMLNLNRYVSYFGFPRGKIDVDSDYIWEASDNDIDKYGALTGDILPDTPLEFALLSYYSPEIVSIRPQEAAGELPANSRTSELKLAAAVWQELQTVKFLDPQNSGRIGRYEGMLRFISQRHNIAQTEIISAACAGMAATVSEEFNKIGFLLENSRTNSIRSHSAVLSRNTQTGQYILSYGGAYTNNETRIITANSLEVLLSEMRNGRYKADFDQTGIGQVREKAELIPAVVYAEWKTKGVARGADALALVTETLTNFYLNPNRDTYNIILGIYARYGVTSSTYQDNFAFIASSSFISSVSALDSALGLKVGEDVFTTNLVNLSRQPNDSRFNIFTTRYPTSTGN
ncbi:MAG: hypothetical protein LBG22_13350 [Treponema sp.]|jgi:hypothetical protein|nr:hypothetical protein [Treponema sp.]